ncbi:chromosome partitioning protein ParB [Ralstonia pseudosolanacearum]|uniref:ParB/RepB/Spo0J family partition protein n=1 Tax=Ralstonia pseudosolanacearum TaxID=1310165 RepID=UPI000AF972A7|nr:ParB/RepB/Spo0J family partition protein [Ralstonia pseudosolanacearum]AXV99177.1 chromosome partitioning protein ParB [Ralstonia solanacearum]AZU59737.1 chromosome partitioning protein ParB [Ralstonia solanacearum]NKF92469.1 chromosome partitioning protein ParB [Ralstonia solanacearum]RAA04973.1 chromosome partitioning protein ParB [Ralstonia pseudosolanacearum]
MQENPTSVPLSQLVESEANARKGALNENKVRSLAASIAAHGLLYPLLVTVCKAKGKGRKAVMVYAVAAGRRRHAALRLLCDEGKIDADYAVAVRVVADESAVELSTVENVQREAMHPADEFEAFRRMVEEGAGIETVAAHFGTTAAVIQRRLKLAKVAPTLFAVYRNGDMSLEQLMALTVSDDHAAQEQVWGSRPNHRRTPSELRGALLGEASIASDSPLASFVGRDAYLAAGGREQVDLFSEHGAHWTDGALVQQLAENRLAQQAEAICEAEGWAWAVALVQPDYATLNAYGRAPKTWREPTEAEQAAMDALDRRQQAIETQMEALELSEESDADDAHARLSEELDGIYAERNERETALETVEDKTHVGVIVVLRAHDVEVIRGAVKPDDRKAVAKAARTKGRGATAATGEGRVQQAMSEKLVRALTAQRTAALQAVLMERHTVALAALAHAMVLDLAREVYYRCNSGIKVSAKSVAHEMHTADRAVEQSRAWQQIKAASAAWGDRLPGEPEALWQCLLSMPQDELIALLAHCTALTVDSIQSRSGEHSTDALARAVDLDMADWWSATPDSYLGSVRKTDVLQAVSEAVSPAEAVPLASMKKGPMVEAAGRLLEGKRWVPPLLRQHAA